MYEKLGSYYRTKRLPNIWCPGCGNGIILNHFVEAFDKLGLDRDKTVVVSGIGCSSRAPLYLDFDTLHTTHGRAISYATGIKMSRPDLNVIVMTGDGDCSAIGGNHLIHAARRNIDLTVLCFNNNNYGMTNGQYSPTTPLGFQSSTSLYGLIERPFDLCDLVKGAGGSYVGRTTTYHTTMIANMITSGLKNKGFSFLDVITQCPTYFGRKNKLGSPVAMMKWIRDSSITIKEASALPPEEIAGKFVIGEFVNKPSAEYTDEYGKLITRLNTRAEVSECRSTS